MKNIRTYSMKKYTLKFSIWELNAISFVRSYNIPHEEFFPVDLDKFFADIKTKHKLSAVSEESSYYSYS